MHKLEENSDIRKLVSQHDLIYDTPPKYWQDGFVLGNGSLGAIFYAPEGLEWLINKTDVLDARTRGVRRIMPPAEAVRMAESGASFHDFNREERGHGGPEGLGPKSCCHLTMDLGMSGGTGSRSALPAVSSRLSLYEATLQVALDKHLCHPRVESVVHAEEDLLIIRARDVSPLVANRTRIFFSRPEDIELQEPRLWKEGGRLFLHMTMPEAGCYVAAVEVVPRAGVTYRDTVLKQIRSPYHPPEVGIVTPVVNGRFGIINVSGDFDLYLTVASDRDADDPVAEVRRRLDRILTLDEGVIRMSHRNWWHGFWGRSQVQLGEKALEALFYRSLYALGCAYRKAPLSGLLGLFYGPSVGPMQITPWTGDLHHDLNVQCPFFPVHALNHSDLFDAYLETYHEFLPEAKRLARDVWEAPGAHFDMCFNARGKSMMGGVGTYRFWFGGSYVALMHCLCWRYRRDRQQLEERIYPFLKEILAFYLHLLKKGDDGYYHLYPAHACELDVVDTGDPVQVLCMLKVCLQTAIEAAGILAVDRELAVLWTELLENLPPYPTAVDRQGRRVVLDGSGIPADHHVGQAGCLHPVYPCGEIDEQADTSTLRLYQQTLDSVVDKTAQISYARADNFHYQCVWQCFFRAMTALRLGRITEFWEHYMPMFLDTYVKPNGLVSHDACVVADAAESEANLAHIPAESLCDVGDEMPKFEAWCGHGGGTTPNEAAKSLAVPLIEGSADYLTMITETLLQSHNGLIRVFPGWRLHIPAAFRNLVAEGDLLVSAACGDGRVKSITVRRGSNCNQTSFRLRSPWTGVLETHAFADNQEVTLTSKLPESRSTPNPQLAS